MRHDTTIDDTIRIYGRDGERLIEIDAEHIVSLVKLLRDSEKCWVHDLNEQGSCKQCGWPASH